MPADRPLSGNDDCLTVSEIGGIAAYDVAYESFLPQLNLPMGGVAKRSAFVVDKGGVIRFAESSDNPKELPDFVAIKATLSKLA